MFIKCHVQTARPSCIIHFCRLQICSNVRLLAKFYIFLLHPDYFRISELPYVLNLSDAEKSTIRACSGFLIITVSLAFEKLFSFVFDKMSLQFKHL